MGATRISWRTTTTVIIAILQIQAPISARTTAVTGVEGQRFDFSCVYPVSLKNKAKYFCHDSGDNVSPNHLIRTDKHNQWERNGRFSLYDNTTGAFFVVRVDKLIPGDSGTYRCGVDIHGHPPISLIQLIVSRENPAENLTHYITALPMLPRDFTIDKLNLGLYLTTVMCVAAILCVCLFTLCLRLAVKKRRSGPRPNREISSDYETMMPGVITEPERRCSCLAPDCPDLSALPSPTPDLCYHITSKPRDSVVTLNLSEYVNVDVPGHICQYQHLDLSRLEDHVYHSIHGHSGPKDGPLGVKETINC